MPPQSRTLYVVMVNNLLFEFIKNERKEKNFKLCSLFLALVYAKRQWTSTLLAIKYNCLHRMRQTISKRQDVFIYSSLCKRQGVQCCCVMFTKYRGFYSCSVLCVCVFFLLLFLISKLYTITSSLYWLELHFLFETNNYWT